jgi:protein-disulfide isomerase
VSTERKRRLLLLGGAILAAVVVVVVAIAVSQGGSDDGGGDGGGGPTASGGGAQQSQSAEVKALFGGIPQQGVTLGQPDAPATLIEFADLQCPFCAEYTTGALPTVIQDYVRSGRLKMQLRLLRFIGPDSERGAEVAAAATLQNKGWQFSDLFYRNQGQENSGYATDAFLEQLARETPGLDVGQLDSDLDTPAAQQLIRQAERQANALGVSGTPTFFIQKGSGAPQQLELSSLDADSVTAAIDSALGEQ